MRPLAASLCLSLISSPVLPVRVVLGAAADDAAGVLFGAPAGPADETPSTIGGEAGDPPLDADADPAALDANELYEEGALAFSTSDYERAVELFRRSYERAADIADEQQRTRAMNLLLFNLARAQIEAFGLDEDPKRLRMARDLLRKHLESDLGDEDKQGAEELVRELDELLDAAETAETAPEVAGESPVAPAGAGPGDGPRLHPFEITGYTAYAFGALAFGLMGAGLGLGSRAEDSYAAAPNGAERDVVDRRGRAANGMAFTGAIVGGALVIVGTGFLVAGVRKRRQLAGRASVTPAPLRGGVAVSVGGRF